MYWPVKLDMEGMTEPVIALLPETLEEARRFGDALTRCQIRLPAWSRDGGENAQLPRGRRGRSRCIWRRPHTARARQTAKRRLALDEPFYYYGAEDGWLMIRYSVNGGRVWRIGYIDLAALPQTGGQTPLLPFVSGDERARAAGNDAPLTDDPHRRRGASALLARRYRGDLSGGAAAFLWLCGNGSVVGWCR